MHKYLKTSITLAATSMIALIVNHSLTPASASERRNNRPYNSNITNDSGGWITDKKKESNSQKERRLNREERSLNNSEINRYPIGGIPIEQGDLYEKNKKQKRNLQKQRDDLQQDRQRVNSNNQENMKDRIIAALTDNNISLDKIQNSGNSSHNHLVEGGTSSWFLNNGSLLNTYNLSDFLKEKIAAGQMIGSPQEDTTRRERSVIIVEFEIGEQVGTNSRGDNLTKIKILFDPQTSEVWNAFPY